MFNLETLPKGHVDCSEFFEENLFTTGINPRRAIKQIVEYKNDPCNGKTLSLIKASMLHKPELPIAT
ncbi:hypothetical protein [Desulfonatronum thiodismutans]|uniref:hypothetical protein n=1 Tax=Desulfonatronum thiodismutans TaxID=159290 RepID=UPI0004ABD756|nr:hypothetical protein [Desulfonatronum thiodismutans]